MPTCVLARTLNLTCSKFVNISEYQVFTNISESTVSGKAKGLNFGLRLNLNSYLVYASKEGFCESVLLPRLA